MRGRSLQTKLVVLFIIVGIIPASILSVVFMQQLLAHKRSEVIRGSEETVSAISASLLTFQEQAVNAARQFATDERRGMYWTVPILESAERDSMTWRNTHTSLVQALHRLKEESEFQIDDVIVAVKGEVIYSEQGTLTEGAHEFIADAFSSNEVSWSPWIYSPVHEQHFSYVLYPIPSLADESVVSGILGLGISEGRINAMMHCGSTDIEQVAYLVDDTGKLYSRIQSSTAPQAINTVIAGPVLELIQEANMSEKMLSKEYTNYEGRGVLGSIGIIPFANSHLGLVVETDAATAFASVRTLWLQAGVILLGIAFIVGVLSYLGAKGFTRPIVQLAEAAHSIASGDLTVETKQDRSDELGQLGDAFDSMRQSLRQMIAAIEEVVVAASTASQQLSATSQENSAAITQTVEALSALTDRTRQISTLTKEMAANSEQVRSLAQDGKGELDRTKAEITQAVDAAEEMSRVMDVLESGAHQIREVVEIIAEVAEQTNLLALNAAIEAARAGESGRSFAVVAEEVRQLAEQTQRSAANIRDSIQELTHGTEQAAAAAVKSNAEITDTTAAFSALDTQFEGIAAKIDLTTELIFNAAEATQSLERGMHELLATAEQQAQSMRSLAESANAVTQMSERMAQLISNFRV